MSLHYTGIEIKTAHSLESWNGGVLVMVSGSVLMKNFSGRRKFAQTFFLAPQEKGYFVLNDIFHFIDEEPFLHHPVAYLPQRSLDSKLHAPATIREPGTMIEPLGCRVYVLSLEKAFLFFLWIYSFSPYGFAFPVHCKSFDQPDNWIYSNEHLNFFWCLEKWLKWGRNGATSQSFKCATVAAQNISNHDVLLSLSLFEDDLACIMDCNFFCSVVLHSFSYIYRKNSWIWRFW